MASYQIVSNLGVPYAGTYASKDAAKAAAKRLESRHGSPVNVRTS